MRYCVKLYGTAGQATDNNIIRHMHLTFWITTAANTHWEYTELLAFPSTNVARTQTNVKLYVHCLFFVILQVLFVYIGLTWGFRVPQ